MVFSRLIVKSEEKDTKKVRTTLFLSPKTHQKNKNYQSAFLSLETLTFLIV